MGRWASGEDLARIILAQHSSLATVGQLRLGDDGDHLMVPALARHLPLP